MNVFQRKLCREVARSSMVLEVHTWIKLSYDWVCAKYLSGLCFEANKGGGCLKNANGNLHNTLSCHPGQTQTVETEMKW